MIHLQEEGLKEVTEAMKSAAANAVNLEPVLKRFGRYMKDISVPENFRKRGRPIPWFPVTRFGEPNQDPLRDQGYLLNSVGFAVEGNDLVLGAGNKSSLRYARIQQEGGTILPKKKFLAIPCVPPLTKSEARTTWPKDWKGKGTFILHGPEGFGIYRKSKQATGVRLGAKSGPKTEYAAGTKGVEMIFRLVKKVKIKARPFLMFQEADLVAFAKAAFAHIFKLKDQSISGGSA